MNEAQYRELCEACDRVLLAPDSTIERVAISWLHVIREHPVFLANYQDLFDLTKNSKVLGRQWRALLRIAGWFWQLGRALRSDGRSRFRSAALPEGIDVLIVSHLLNASQAGQADDFYFGSLPSELVAKGHSVVIALFNHSGQSGADLAAKWMGGAVPRVIFSSALRMYEEIILHSRLRRESKRLKMLANNEAPGLSRRVLTRASEEVLSGITHSNLRVATQISALVEKLKPKAIVVTHEGHAWERVVFASTRIAYPSVRCIGYQHAAMFQLQHAVRRNLASEYNPDQILTAGAISIKQLKVAVNLIGISMSVLGSNRSFKKPTGNSEGMTNRSNARHTDNPSCLVLPEGIASECHLLFEFSLACASACPDIQFIWRCIPL